jgi:hypothetical protein
VCDVSQAAKRRPVAKALKDDRRQLQAQPASISRLGTRSWVRPGSSLSLTVLLELLDNAVRVNVPQAEGLAGSTDLGLGEYGHRLLGPPAPVRAGFSDLHLDRRILGKEVAKATPATAPGWAVCMQILLRLIRRCSRFVQLLNERIADAGYEDYERRPIVASGFT